MWATRARRDAPLTAAAKALIGALSETTPSSEHRRALASLERQLAGTIRGASTLVRQFGQLTTERGGPEDPRACDLARYLTKQERSRLDVALTRSVDATHASTLLFSWKRTHPDERYEAARRDLGIDWSIDDVEESAKATTTLREMQRALRRRPVLAALRRSGR